MCEGTIHLLFLAERALVDLVLEGVDGPDFKFSCVDITIFFEILRAVCTVGPFYRAYNGLVLWLDRLSGESSRCYGRSDDAGRRSTVIRVRSGVKQKTGVDRR